MGFPYKTNELPSWSHFAMYQGQQHTSPPDRYKDAADIRPRTAEGRDRPLTPGKRCEQCRKTVDTLHSRMVVVNRDPFTVVASFIEIPI